jgi:hypothetical protein
MKCYNAHWSGMLISISVALTILCVAIGVGGMLSSSSGLSWLSWLPLLFAAGCALFTIRGYTITPDAILVHRLLWATELPRRSLESARFDPNAMRWSIRTFGNGGFYSFSGFYWNKSLGAYRAYVTDPSRTVVLRYSPKGTVLVSPAAPAEFVRDLDLPT